MGLLLNTAMKAAKSRAARRAGLWALRVAQRNVSAKTFKVAGIFAIQTSAEYTALKYGRTHPKALAAKAAAHTTMGLGEYLKRHNLMNTGKGFKRAGPLRRRLAGYGASL